MMHPRIEQLAAQAIANGFEKPDLNLLVFLSSIDASRTEAEIVLHQGFGLTLDETHDLVMLNTDLFPPCTVQDVFYECAVYMSYDPDDPNYRVEEDFVRIPLKPGKEK